MDLSFSFDRQSDLVAWPADLAALMVGVAVRQGASPTAAAQGRLPAGGVSTGNGAGSFNPAVAALLAGWREGVNAPFTERGQGIFKPGDYHAANTHSSGAGSPIEDR